MSLQKICFVGANGSLGSVLLSTILAANTFTISVLKRHSSKSTLPSSVNVIPIPDDLPLDALTEALKGQDAVIAVFPLTDVSQHLRLVEAAFRAGVKRFIPADFGSCDAADEEPTRLLKLYRDKNMVREKCEKLAEGNDQFTWTALIPGHLFDYGLKGGLLHFNLKTQTAQILDGGAIPASASTLTRVAAGTLAILNNPSTTRNRTIYIQSFCHTQLEVLAALEKATGTKWKRQDVNSKEFLEREVKRYEESEGKEKFHAMEEVVFVLGQLNADWRKREGFAMEELGLEDEDLEEVVKRVVDEEKEKA